MIYKMCLAVERVADSEEFAAAHYSEYMSTISSSGRELNLPLTLLVFGCHGRRPQVRGDKVWKPGSSCPAHTSLVGMLLSF